MVQAWKWKMEIFRMTCYMAFPVTMFHYFNSPQLYENYVIKAKRETGKPVSHEDEEKFKKLFNKIKKKEQLNYLQKLESTNQNVST